MPALIIGANIPDIDATCVIYGTESLAMRRGLTHGPIAWIVLPLALAAILWAFDRWQTQRGKRPEGRAEVRFGWLWLLAFIATMTHPALDWLNVYGIRLLAPFSQQWFYGDTLFIIDIWLWLGLGSALWLSLRREKRARAVAHQGSPDAMAQSAGGVRSWRRPAWAALVLAVLYIAGNGVINQAVLGTTSINMKGPNFPYRGQIETVFVSPVPINPLARQVIAGRRNQWFIGEINELGAYKPLGPITDKRCAWPDTEKLRASDPALDAFLFWSRAPFAERDDDGSVVLRDARFYFGGNGKGREQFSVALPGTPCRPISDEQN